VINKEMAEKQRTGKTLSAMSYTNMKSVEKMLKLKFTGA